MDFYKKIINNKNIRFRILSLLRFVPDDLMLKIQYRIKLGRKLNLENPKRYTEKIQWYKINHRDPIMAECADKFLVRDFVKSRGLEHILNDLYAKFDSYDDIAIDDLPESFVLKHSNGSGTNLIVRDKSKLKLDEVKKKFKDYMAQSNASAGREWVYNVNKPVIVAEKLLEDSEQKDGIYDYKFLCFDGTPCCVWKDIGRYTDHRRNFYDMEWNDLHITSDHPRSDFSEPRPAKFEEMIEIASTLSKGFPAVRVDLYQVDNRVVFGEMTFYPWSGYVQFVPDEFDFELGKKFVLPSTVK